MRKHYSEEFNPKIIEDMVSALFGPADYLGDVSDDSHLLVFGELFPREDWQTQDRIYKPHPYKSNNSLGL